MKRNLLIIYFLILASYSLGQVKVTTTAVNFRSTPEIDNNKICVIPVGTIVTLVYDSVKYKSWTKVNYNDKIGFVYTTYLKEKSDQSANPPQSEVKYYKNSSGEKVQSPTHYNSAPSGASAECNDGTYSFSRSRRGTCSHHGGVKRWL